MIFHIEFKVCAILNQVQSVQTNHNQEANTYAFCTRGPLLWLSLYLFVVVRYFFGVNGIESDAKEYSLDVVYVE